MNYQNNLSLIHDNSFLSLWPISTYILVKSWKPFEIFWFRNFRPILETCRDQKCAMCNLCRHSGPMLATGRCIYSGFWSNLSNSFVSIIRLTFINDIFHIIFESYLTFHPSLLISILMSDLILLGHGQSGCGPTDFALISTFYIRRELADVLILIMISCNFI